MNLLRTGRAIATQFSLSFSSPCRQRNSLYSTKTAVNSLKKKKPLEEFYIPKTPQLQDEIEDPESNFLIRWNKFCSAARRKDDLEESVLKSSPEEIKKRSSSASDWPRPSEIPWQGKVANSVNLIGRLKMPIQFHTSSDGNTWAATVIAQDNSKTSASSLRIPLIFEGDLAHVASCHLKEEDHVYIDGQLSADPPPFTLNYEQSSLQVRVQNVNFVDDSPSKKRWSNRKIFVPLESSETGSTNRKKESRGDDYGGEESVKGSEFNLLDQSLLDVITNPNEWWDIRLKQPNPESAAFEHKENGKLVHINESTPNSIKETLECLTFDCKSGKKSSKANMPNSGDSTWRDLLKNPKQWRDHRENKLNGSVKPKYPDFKNKDSGAALWLNSAPEWALEALGGLEFDVPFQTVKKPDDNSWRDLVENPGKWWDNRANKRSPKYPDFKHKDSGTGLWLEDKPAWAVVKKPSFY